jgi:hypothetical protein
MRSTMSGRNLCAFLLIFTCFACGGGGGGGGGATTLADLQAEIAIPNPGETATALIQVLSDGTINWAGAVPPDLVPDVTGFTINRVSDASVLADLLGAGAFDTVTGTTSGTVAISAADAADLAANPGDYLVTLLTSTKPPASGGLAAFTAAEWHSVLLGSNESPVADASARGAATFKVTSPTTMDFVIAMVTPVEADITLAHIHVGAVGVNGIPVVDLQPVTATHDAAAGTISGTVTVDGETLARISADLAGFYCNVHTAAAPNGVARGQLDEGTVEMTAALLGSAEVPTVVDGFARGGATFEFTSLTGGTVMTALHSASEDIDDVIMQHIHIGASGTPGPILVNLMGPDYLTSPGSNSAEATISFTQKDFTRILANPAGFYCNLHTTAAQGGLVRGQLSTGDRTVFAALSGAEETTPVPGASGTMRVIFTGVHACEYTVTMASPAASELDNAHIHDGPTGADGPILVDLFESGDASVSGNTITGTAAVAGRTLARLLAGTPGGSALAGGDLPSIFYGNVHTLANPGGVARGQFTQISGDTPPAGLAYTSPVTYLTGQPITPNAPTSLGGAITSYSIVPPLSQGLAMSSSTGIISGTPTQTRVATNYTVTASNAAGSTTATVNITVNEGPPLTLSYNSPVGYILNQAITPNVPVRTGGAPTSYGVNPALPTGLTLNGTTGVISGTPTAVAAAANYTVTGTNSAGSVQATVNIAVTSNVVAPTNLVYSTPVNYPTGYAITANTPTVSGTTPMTFSVTPSLPAGLALNGSTGVISGTPTTVTAGANYTVTATNSAGSTQGTVNITVGLGTPGPMTYSPGSFIIGYIGTAITPISPQHTGGGAVSSYSISGTLLAGLSFNTTTGVISGTPTATTPDGNADGVPDTVNHTVTATNASGTSTTTVSIIGY